MEGDLGMRLDNQSCVILVSFPDHEGDLGIRLDNQSCVILVSFPDPVWE